MLTAYDENGIKVDSRNASKKIAYSCCGCGQPMILKAGPIKAPHFAHQKGALCPYDSDGMTEWHREWQYLFGEGNYEIVSEQTIDDDVSDDHVGICLDKGVYKKIADVQINNTVIEFQHSSISIDEVYERTAFHLYNHRRVIWVVEYLDRYHNIENEQWVRPDSFVDGYFCWKRMLHWFDDLNPYDGLIEIYLHVSDDELLRILDRGPMGDYDDYTYKYFIGKSYTKSEFLKRMFQLCQYRLDGSFVALPNHNMSFDVQHMDLDLFTKNESCWVWDWKDAFDNDLLCDVPVNNGVESHVSDVVVNGYAIRFLTSYITQEEFNAVNEFYTNIYSQRAGRNIKVLWVIREHSSSIHIKWSYYNMHTLTWEYWRPWLEGFSPNKNDNVQLLINCYDEEILYRIVGCDGDSNSITSNYYSSRRFPRSCPLTYEKMSEDAFLSRIANSNL